MIKKLKFSGFSLIEVSIAMLIIGVISSILMTQFNTINKTYATQKTIANMEFVVKSIGAYYLANDCAIPFPSRANGNIGRQSASLRDSAGLVPFKTLGIMERFAKDGKGRWLTYRMNPRFGKATSQGSFDNLGIKDFSSDISGDKVAIVISAQNSHGTDDIVIWFSEKSFISNFANGKFPQQEEERIGLDTGQF